MLKKLGIEFFNVLDVGSNAGNWARSIKQNCLKNSTFYLIEPNGNYLNLLSKIGNVFQVVLSDNEKEVDFFSIGGTGDSYFKEKTFHYKDILPQKIHTTTLDLLPLPRIDLIKIDTQGSEIDILRGYKNCEAKAIILEIPISEYNHGAPKFSEYIDFMQSIDYIPVKLIDEHYIDFELKQLDLGFLERKLLSNFS